MAYYLEFDGVNDTVTIPDMDFLTTTSWKLEFRLAMNSATTNFKDFPVVGRTNNDQSRIMINTGGGDGSITLEVRFSSSGSRSVFNISGGRSALVDGLPHTYTITRDANDIRLQVADATFDSTDVNTNTSSLACNGLFTRRFSGFTHDLYLLKLYSDPAGTTITRDLNPSSSGGTGLTLPDDFDSAGDGTLVNFPTDNSQWVFYSAGGANASAIVESAQSFTAAQSVTVASNTTLSIAESAQAFSSAQAVTVTSNISLSLSESAQVFTSAIAATTTGNISASLVEQAQAFTSLLNVTVAGNITSSIVESAQPFSTTMGVTVTSSATNNSSIVESAQVFTSAITMTTTGNLSASIVESAQVFTSAINVNLVGSNSLAVAEQAQPFTTTITVNRLTTVSGTILESAQVFVAGVVVQTPTLWTDKVFLDATWTDSTNPTTTWSDNTNPTNIWTDK